MEPGQGGHRGEVRAPGAVGELRPSVPNWSLFGPFERAYGLTVGNLRCNCYRSRDLKRWSRGVFRIRRAVLKCPAGLGNILSSETVAGVLREPATKESPWPTRTGGSLIIGGTMAKEFKTVSELVSLLESRGVATDAETAPAIERESYYAIVNGYKGPFLDRTAMQASSGDVYVSGTKFSWIYSLFLFDRELRGITFKYLIRAEAVMRTAVAYAFSHRHPQDGAYLERANFCTANDYLVPQSFRGDKAALHGQNIAFLMRMLNNKLVINDRTRDFVRHYMRTYGKVPLWVLANDLTFGNIVHFYQLMQPNDRNEVCSIVARDAGRDSRQEGFLSPRMLLRAGNVLKGFRNICAHDERLYCAKVDGASIADMVGYLAVFIGRDESTAFVNEVTHLWDEYAARIPNVSFISLFNEMGFIVRTH